MNLIETFPLSPPEIFFVFVIMVISAVIQGTIGFGSGLFAVPFLVLINPLIIPGPMVFSAIILSSLISYKNREYIDFSDLKIAIFGRVPGSIIGVMVLKILAVNLLSILVGCIILLSVFMSVINIHIKLEPKNLFFAGVLSGIMCTTSSVGGPPIALMYQHEKSARIRGSINGFFIFGTLTSLIVLIAMGKFGQVELSLSFLLLPGIIFGFLISIWISKWVKEKYFRPAILVFSSTTAMVVIFKNIL